MIHLKSLPSPRPLSTGTEPESHPHLPTEEGLGVRAESNRKLCRLLNRRSQVELVTTEPNQITISRAASPSCWADYKSYRVFSINWGTSASDAQGA